jgi:transaldolase
MTTIQHLDQLGQSIWYDNISRSLIRGGELRRHVEEGLTGVTSNPTIFDKAISGGNDYNEQIHDLVEKNPRIGTAEIIQSLMITDIQMACDVLAPVYQRTHGRDGFVSVEVTPSKARDTKATIEEVRFLWGRIDRRNLMVKIPATKEGLPAIEQSIAEGMNINVTLIFSLERYREVAIAYIAGLERRLREGKSPAGIASVASVFVSRIDTLVDDLLTKKIASASPSDAERLRALMGKSAVANTKMIYQAFKDIFMSDRFKTFEQKEARLQRPLWGSTGTKNPAYSDLLYVDTLIGRDTVNTVPPATYAAFLDHGKPVVSIETDLVGAWKVIADLAAVGVDMRWVMQKLEEDGVSAFEKSFDGLYKNLEAKRKEISEAAVPRS